MSKGRRVIGGTCNKHTNKLCDDFTCMWRQQVKMHIVVDLCKKLNGGSNNH